MSNNTSLHFRFLALVAAGILSFALTAGRAAWAQDSDQKEKKPAPGKEEKVQTGVISTIGSYGQSVSFGSNTSDQVPGDVPNTISGSIKHTTRGKCQAVVTNSSEENSYSVSFKVVTVSAKWKTSLKNSYVATLKPKQNVTRDFSCGDENMQIVLQSAKKIGK